MRRLAFAACLAVALPAAAHATDADYAAKLTTARKDIKHVVIIMQENRSFDSYFGTFPGANGIPAGICVPLDPANPGQGCIAPFHDGHDLNAAATHRAIDAQGDIDDGITTTKMDGFNLRQTLSGFQVCKPTASPTNCVALLQGLARHDVMGYHDATELPNYWTYAKNFVLQDQLYAGVRSFSWPSHMDLTSEWAATCTNSTDAMSCNSDTSPVYPQKGTITLPWANLFQLLDVHNVSWKTYIGAGIEPDCADGDMVCPARPQAATTASIWNVAPLYAWVQAAGATYLASHVQPATRFLSDLQANTLPQVSWIVPTAANSEHPPASITVGMEYVTALVNGVMQSRAAAETVIFIAWDDWGGFYDHVPPPNVDTNQTAFPIQGYGLRVPGIMISLHAKKAYIDHSVLSFDSYARFFEDLFANSARLDPAALGNPDNRPDIRDEINAVTFVGGATQRVGDLLDEFDFVQPKLPRLVLSTAIPFHLSANCKASTNTLLCTAANVVLTWDAIPIGATGTPPYSYQVTRDGAPLTACLTTATRCVDVIPASGAHLYRIHSVDSAGVVSPNSAAVEADLP